MPSVANAEAILAGFVADLIRSLFNLLRAEPLDDGDDDADKPAGMRKRSMTEQRTFHGDALHMLLRRNTKFDGVLRLWDAALATAGVEID